MNLPRSVRVLLALGVVVLGLAALLLVLVIGEAAFTIKAHLDDYADWVGLVWWSGLILLGLIVGVVVWRLLVPKRKPQPTADSESSQAALAPTAEEVAIEVEKARAAGVDTGEIERELEELKRRREAGEIHVALFGEISTGKSTLIAALLPDVETVSDVRGGTTRDLIRYEWRSPGGDRLILTDMPGTAEADGSLDAMARSEAERAHLVVYVTDGDLNRRQHVALTSLLAIAKPMILVLNKTDRYSAADADRLSERLASLLADRPNTAFVRTSAATEREVIVQHADGRETLEVRPVAPDVKELAVALQRLIDSRQEILDELRDSAGFLLASRRLDEAVARARREKADKLVDAYAVKAVIGAMAAVTPGSDLVIQGLLGTQMVREITALYGTRASKVDTDLLFKLVQKHVGRAHTLILAVAGNAFKAFPGVGTLAGGAMHAVAYGIIFRTLGRALARSLATRGEFHPRQTAKQFEETLGEDLESSARSLARVVIEKVRRSGSQP